MFGSKWFTTKKKSELRELDRNAPTDPLADWWYNMITARGSTGGQMVSATTAQRVAAVYACTTAICESVATLPISVYEESDERRKQKLDDHPLQVVLHEKPNSFQDPFVFIETMQSQILDTGNAYAWIGRTNGGWIDRLIPLEPDRMQVKLEYNRGEQKVIYIYTDPNGARETFPAEQVFHLKYRSRDGITGRSPVQTAAGTFGYSLALLEHGNRVFENGAFLSGLIKAPFAFKDDESRERFMDSFKKFFGASNAGKMGLLEQGVDYVPFQMNNKDAQFLEARDASILDICRIYRVPPVFAQCTDKGMSYASIEQLCIIWVQYTIQPWITRWERAIKRQLLGEESDDGVFVRFNVAALIRGDLKSRTESLVQQLQYGLKTINEARNLLDENAVDDEIGDELLLSHNLIPASKIMEDPQPQPPQLKPADDDESEPVDDDAALEEPAEPGAQNGPQSDDRGASSANGPGRKDLFNGGDVWRFRPLFETLVGRLVRRELRFYRSAEHKPGFIRKVQDFWKEHPGLVRETLSPAVDALGAPRDDVDRALVLDGWIVSYYDRRTAELVADRAIVNDDSRALAEELLGRLINAKQKEAEK